MCANQTSEPSAVKLPIRIIFAALCVLAHSVSGTLHAQDTTNLHFWTASDGRVIQAKFLKLHGESVVLEKEGKRFTVPFAKLNAVSVALAKELSRPLGSPPAGFSLIPGGEFMMGANGEDSDGDEQPHKVRVSAFYMQQKEVTKAEWDAVRTWGLEHGYTDLPKVYGKAADHPAQNVTWYGVVKWCNAKSEMEKLPPCYYKDTAQTALYRAGELDIHHKMVKWGAIGYRLPTEAEWEKAARGGLVGKRFPWGDAISHAEANFNNVGAEYFQKGSTGLHPSYAKDGGMYTAPAGSFAANGYGLFDMAGNAVEWCWDWYDGEYYLTSTQADPRGAASGLYRVVRGGSWAGEADFCRTASRTVFVPGRPDRDDNYAGSLIGFRPARSPATQGGR